MLISIHKSEMLDVVGAAEMKKKEERRKKKDPIPTRSALIYHYPDAAGGRGVGDFRCGSAAKRRCRHYGGLMKDRSFEMQRNS